MSIESVLKSAVEEEKVPFVVGMTGNANGVTHQSAFGSATAARAVDADTVFRIFSMTKAVGGLAAAILVDRGKLELDTPVGDILEAWNELQVLEGFEGEKPVLRAPQTQATLRHLVTHTSGLEYEFWNTDVPRYMEVTGHPTILSGLKNSLNYPLTSDPGTRWGYGPSTDWLGQMIEAADGRRIDVFCQEEIFEPLGRQAQPSNRKGCTNGSPMSTFAVRTANSRQWNWRRRRCLKCTAWGTPFIRPQTITCVSCA